MDLADEAEIGRNGNTIFSRLIYGAWRNGNAKADLAGETGTDKTDVMLVLTGWQSINHDAGVVDTHLC